MQLIIKIDGVDPFVIDGVEKNDNPTSGKGVIRGNKSKVRTLAEVDVTKVQNMAELIDTVLTENRLKQGIDKLHEMGKEISEKSTGDYIRWVHNDIVKEELDRIMAGGFEPKDLGKPVSTKARQWFFAYLDSNIPTIQE